MQCGIQSHLPSKSKDKKNSRQQDSSGLPRHSPAAKITNVTPNVQKSCRCNLLESVLYILLYALQSSYVTVCYMCVLWAKILLQCHRCCCFGFKYVLPVCVLFYVWSEKLYFSVYFDISVGTKPCKCVPLPVFGIQIRPFSLCLAFLPWLQRGTFVTLCADFELVCLVGRVTWTFHELWIIPGAVQSFEFIKTAWAAETSHSYPTSTSQCRCSSPARAQQGAGHQPQSRPVDLISVRQVVRGQ